jgi:hypothetical protein
MTPSQSYQELHDGVTKPPSCESYYQRNQF